MKRQGSAPHIIREEREQHPQGSDWLEKLVATPKVPKVDTKIFTGTARAAHSEVKKSLEVATAQLFGIELKSGKAVSINKGEKTEAPAERPPQVTEAFYEYKASLNNPDSRKDREGQAQISQQIEMVLMELKNLKESSDELDAAFKDVVIDEVPQKPGIYHLRFFEGFLKMIMNLREKVDDASIFAKLFKSRKSERKYSSMAKKGGTSFTLHHDRAVATQSG